jgi:beta-lactam-binding protein with PASTA domain
MDENRSNFHFRLKGSGDWVIDQYPRAGIQALLGDTIELSLGNLNQELPDFSGLSLGRVLELLSYKGIAVRYKGVGMVKHQTPAPGISLDRVDHIDLVLGEG